VPLRDGIEAFAFVTDLDRRLAACDLALVQGGLATCMELTAANVPFIYFPLRHHFEQNFHVAYRLDRYGAGIRMDYGDSDPDRIADIMVEAIRKPAAFTPVEANGAKLAADMLADLL
jgi:UDP-N-acetylglucosamine:LPS N-acetylglucosamine transferase